jgi:transposase InsO family protein
MSREGDLFILRGSPEYIRLDNGAEFIAKKVQAWIGAVGAKTALITPGSPLSGHRPAMPCRAAQGKRLLRELQRSLSALSADCFAIACRVIDELLNGEVFYSLREAQILIERWRRHYNTPSRACRAYPAGQWSGHIAV